MADRIIELIDKGTYLGQLALIRYHLVDPSGVADPAVAVADYLSDVLPTLVGWQNVNYLHTSLVYKEVYPTQGLQVEVPIVSGGAGTQMGTPLPGPVTWSLKWVIGATTHLDGDTGPHIKRGGKHLGGVEDGDVVGNVFVSPSAFATLAAAYWAAFTGMISDSWLPAVAHQPPPVAHVSPPVSRYALILDAISQGVGSQVSRKPRHGA